MKPPPSNDNINPVWEEVGKGPHQDIPPPRLFLLTGKIKDQWCRSLVLSGTQQPTPNEALLEFWARGEDCEEAKVIELRSHLTK